MQRSLSVSRARFPSITKTAWGQTTAHRPQPVHFSGSYRSVTTFLRYWSGVVFLLCFSG